MSVTGHDLHPWRAVAAAGAAMVWLGLQKASGATRVLLWVGGWRWGKLGCTCLC